MTASQNCETDLCKVVLIPKRDRDRREATEVTQAYTVRWLKKNTTAIIHHRRVAIPLPRSNSREISGPIHAA
jgi:hypothetical protein